MMVLHGSAAMSLRWGRIYNDHFVANFVLSLQYGSIFNHFYIIGFRAADFGRITQNNGHFAVQCFGTNCKPICDFLLLINTKILIYIQLHTISKWLQIIGEICIFDKGGTSIILVWGESLNSGPRNSASRN